MPVILNIETATLICSVALARDGQLLGLKESSGKNPHSSVITSYIDEVVRSSGLEFPMLDAIAVSSGPGSYTGLRIGVATAKGLCYALDKPLIAVPTLQAMATPLPQLLSYNPQAFGSVHPNTPVTRHPSPVTTLFCPMLDARRMEVYCALFDYEGNQIREIRAEIIDENSFSGYLKDHKILFAGEGSGKCRTILEKNENAFFIEDLLASASYMIPLAEAKFLHQEFENLAYFEPFYLKDFVAGKPRVRGLI